MSSVVRNSLNTGRNIGRYLISPHAFYHSFPDPKEDAKISTHIASKSPTIDKSKLSLSLDPKFEMSSEFPGGNHFPSSPYSKKVDTICTTLPNGLRIASEDRPSLMSSLAFVVKTGSAHETELNRGVTQFLEINSFKSTSLRSHHQLSADLENIGAFVQCISTRENIFFCIDVLRENIEKGLEILAETILLPPYSEEDIENSKSIISWSSNEMDGNILSRDAAQLAAYSGSPLSNPHYCPEEYIPKLNSKMLLDFKTSQFFGSNCVVSGSGIDHETLVKLVTARFSEFPSTSPTYRPRLPSKYTGGLHLNERTLKEPFTRVCIGFECGGWHDESLVPLCVLQTLLGGGNSFSAGGPGKGMYSRLYSEVLGRCYWADSIEAFITVHEDTGLFGIDGSCDAEHVPTLIQTIIMELARLAVQPVKDDELSRAKNMVKSVMMTQLESRLIVCEDIGRQFITYGRRESPESLCLKIDNVTKADLLRVARKMLSSPPSVGIVGQELKNIPNYGDIKSFTIQKRDELFKRYGVI